MRRPPTTYRGPISALLQRMLDDELAEFGLIEALRLGPVFGGGGNDEVGRRRVRRQHVQVAEWVRRVVAAHAVAESSVAITAQTVAAVAQSSITQSAVT